MENVLNWSWFLHGKWSELIMIFTWKIVWIDQDFLHHKWSKVISIVPWKMVWIDQDFYMINGLNWPGLLHGKYPELIRIIAWQMVWINLDFTPYFWADSVEDLGGSSNLRESTQKIHFHVVYCRWGRLYHGNSTVTEILILYIGWNIWSKWGYVSSNENCLRFRGASVFVLWT